MCLIVVVFQFIVFVVVLVLKGSLWDARTMDSPLTHEKLVQATLIESWALLRVCLFVH